ncbi:uncharacterized protein LOC123257370 [Drosophila ananassae]|uniref:uncharacterized protein LOC123257370 n=1 Tax=Drosophila ananassae TaxID=7217 RepID=UPI001CFFBE36|nr:uncharacterized protein LOC123257370 [Drosophila ananassae]
MSDNLQTELGVMLSLQLTAQLSASLSPQLSENLASTLGSHCANGQPVPRTHTPTKTVGYSPPGLGYVHPPGEPTHSLEVSAPSPVSYEVATARIPGWTPRRLPDLPDFESQPEEWPIFLCAFTETTAAYQCSQLENNQRLVKALKGDPRETPIQEATIARIVPFATKVSNLAAFLQSTTIGSQHLGNPTLMEELIAKLPLSKRLDWAKHAVTIQPYSTVVHLSEWLHEFARLVCTITDVGAKEQPKRRILHANSVREEERYADRPRFCPICEGQHQIRDCKEFNGVSTTTRMESARKLRLCFSCLDPGNMSRFCRKSRGCNVYGCQIRHHYLLHESPGHPRRPYVAEEQSGPTAIQRQQQTEWNSTTSGFQREEPSHNTHVDTYALLDEGSSVTHIDDELIRNLNLKVESRQLNVQWFGGKSAKEHTKVVNLQISAAGKPKRHELKNVYGVANLNLPMQSLRWDDVQAVKANARLPVKPYNNASHRTCPVPQDYLLEKMVSDYFEIENFGVKPAQPVAAGGVELAPSVTHGGDARAMRILEETTKRVGRRYETGLLWRDDEVSLPESYKRLVNIEKKMRRDVDFARAYKGLIDDYVKKGYARRLKPQEVQRFQEGKLWYLPHFGVEIPNKPEKNRLVFDAAAKVNSVSLNSALLKGPQRYKPLPAVLFHFREGTVGVCADIKEMFHQVLMQPQDTGSQRFLWRNGDDQREPDVYEMQVMTFGAACSPCSADYVKTVNASQYSSTNPRAALAIKEYHYVDDYVDSFTSEEEYIAVSTRVREIHADAGFHFCRFTSSSASVVKALNPLESIASVRRTEAEEKVLEMYWQPATDDFKFGIKYHRVPRIVNTGERVPTKREFLRLVMSTFDSIGFLNCYMVTAKLLMREIWRKGVNWDEPLPDDLAAAFEDWG